VRERNVTMTQCVSTKLLQVADGVEESHKKGQRLWSTRSF